MPCDRASGDRAGCLAEPAGTARAIAAANLPGVGGKTVENAWSRLHAEGYLTPADGVNAPTGRHLWRAANDATAGAR